MLVLASCYSEKIRMPSILSKDLAAKILGREWSFGYNCYEVGHTWTPNCTDAALEISTAACLKVLPLYAMLYTFSQVAVQRKYDLPATWDTIKSISRSSWFIFFHAYNGSVFGCAFRQGFGRFYYRVLVCAPALLSSYLSLMIEKPARRQALAFYMLNLASEILYRMAVTKGYWRPVKHGETLLFALSLAAWYNLIKEHGFGHDPVSAAVKVLIGRDEAKSRGGGGGGQQPLELVSGTTRENHHLQATKILDSSNGDNGLRRRQATAAIANKGDSINNNNNNNNNNNIDNNNNSNNDDKLPTYSQPSEAIRANSDKSLFEYIIKLTGLRNYSGSLSQLLAKHHCCPHKEASCLGYTLGPIPSRFLVGYLIQSILKLSGRPYFLLQSPGEALRASLTSPASIRFGLFLASLVSSGRLTSCLLRRHSNSNQVSWHGSVSGFVAGLSMFWAPRSSLSMYIMWKAVEQYYLLAARQGKVKFFNFTIMSIYSMSAATILYTFALEPKFVRPSYMKFLDNLSNHRLHQLNRMVLDVFGTGSSVGYEDYFPDLDPKLMSNQFKELIFNWMIQPYE